MSVKKVRKANEKLKNFDEREILWKQRFETLVSRLEDIKIEVERETLETSSRRAFVVSDRIYLSFLGDVVSSNEETAIEFFGEGNYDTYKLEKTGRDND